MGRSAVLTLLLVLAGCADAQDAARLADCRAVSVTDGPGGPALRGGEDLVVDRAAGLALVSFDDRRAVKAARSDGTVPPRGGIYAIALADLAGGARSVAARHLTPAGPASFHPHGIDLAAGTLFVVNHPEQEGGPGSTVELFDYAAGALVHRRTVSDPLFVSLNDVAGLDGESFLATNDHGRTTGAGRLLEDVLGLAEAGVMHWDGRSVRRAVAGVPFANGIAADGRFVHVTSARDGRLRTYSREAVLAGPAAAEPHSQVPLDGALDNLNWDGGGRLLLGAHPSGLRFALHALMPRLFPDSPSAVLRVALSDGRPTVVETLYRDDGAVFSGSSAAAEGGGMLLVGAVFAEGIAICPMDPG